MTLHDFTDDEPPQIERYPGTSIEAPDPQSGIAGWLRKKVDENILYYVSERRRFKHFFRKHQGYAISKTILSNIWKRGVRVALMLEEPRADYPEGRTIKYRLSTFADSQKRAEVDNEGDVQYVVPVADADRVWETQPTLQ